MVYNEKSEKDNYRRLSAKANYNALHSLEIEKYHCIFTERLKTARESMNLTQAEAAKKLGVSLPAYRKYEQLGGNRIDMPYFIQTLVDAFGVSADYLIGKAEQPHPEYEEVIKTTGLNAEAIRQLQELHAQDGADNNPGYLAFINCFLGNKECTGLFFQGLVPLLRDLDDASGKSERMTNMISVHLADYIYDYIVKVVVPTYAQLYWDGTYAPASVEQYLTDSSASSKKERE